MRKQRKREEKTEIIKLNGGENKETNNMKKKEEINRDEDL